MTINSQLNVHTRPYNVLVFLDRLKAFQPHFLSVSETVIRTKNFWPTPSLLCLFSVFNNKMGVGQKLRSRTVSSMYPLHFRMWSSPEAFSGRLFWSGGTRLSGRAIWTGTGLVKNGGRTDAPGKTRWIDKPHWSFRIFGVGGIHRKNSIFVIF